MTPRHSFSRPRVIQRTLGRAFVLGTGLASCAVVPNDQVISDQSSVNQAIPDQDGLSGRDGRLIWADEFDSARLDPAIWSLDDHRNRAGWYNEEAQYYALNNVSLRDGVLVITARMETRADAPDWGGQDYSSARLHTKGRKALRYGRVEARINVPCGRGLWPAFWMLPEDPTDWPAGGEIDIMEFVGHDPNRFHATVHTARHNHADRTEKGRKQRMADACNAWHVHTLDWTADRITIGVNGEPYFTYRNAGAGPEQWPFDKPFHILLNMAVGGSWGGMKGIDPAVFPAEMQVDYVRVYAPG